MKVPNRPPSQTGERGGHPLLIEGEVDGARDLIGFSRRLGADVKGRHWAVTADRSHRAPIRWRTLYSVRRRPVASWLTVPKTYRGGGARDRTPHLAARHRLMAGAAGAVVASRFGLRNLYQRITHAANERDLDAGDMGPHKHLRLPMVACKDGLVNSVMIVMSTADIMIFEGNDVPTR